MAKYPERVEAQRNEIVEQIVADMQKKSLEWIKPFACGTSPHNPISKTTYKGGNRLHLSYIGRKRGYEDPRWATFHQGKRAGFHLRRGAKSAVVEKWKAIRVDDGTEEEAIGDTDTSRVFLKCIGYWSVFNFEEFTDAPQWIPPDYPSDPDRASQLADSFIRSSRCDILERESDSAYYAPAADEIVIPLRGQFSNNVAFLRVLWHEMTHSTMHSSTPAARDHGGWFGSPSYAFEELIAELGSVFIGNDCAFSTSADETAAHYEQHVAYLQNWITALQDDPSYLFRAAAIAEKATEYITSNLASSSCV